MVQNSLPKLLTFDGEARSGKGTIVQATKDYLRDMCGYKVMLIDAGQVFRVLVVGATRASVDLEDPTAIDTFLSDEAQAEACVQLVKAVYRMDKSERDVLLYSNEIGVNSAKIGARSKSQVFKDMLLKKWLQDARREGFEIVLLDGRALEETGQMLESDGLCNFTLGFYFVCDPLVGARRTLGFASEPYEKLSAEEQKSVDTLAEQIVERNAKDAARAVQPIRPPVGVNVAELPSVPTLTEKEDSRQMFLIDTSKQMTIDEMTSPLIEFIAKLLK